MEEKKPRYSIVIPNYNGLEVLNQCIASIIRNTSDYECIVVDNGSTDGSLGYMKDIESKHDNIHTIEAGENLGFARATNLGLAKSKGDYIVWLNNDTIVTPNWCQKLSNCIDNASDHLMCNRIGLAGPCSNYVAGKQQVRSNDGKEPVYSIEQLDKFSTDLEKGNEKNWGLTGFLSGFCLMMKREVYEAVGDLEDWSKYTDDNKPSVGGFEDNDYVLRAYFNGYLSVIAGDTFIHHYGSQTLDKYPEMKRGVANHKYYLKKWQSLKKENNKLIGVLRLRWPPVGVTFKEVLDKAGSFCDALCIVDNGMTDRDKKIVSEHPKVKKYKETDGLNERRDRNILIELAAELDPDWIISIDGDEVFEDKFNREYVERLMNPPWPQFNGYAFHWYTWWNMPEYWRQDGIFGRISGSRMWRYIPGFNIRRGNNIGFHCGNIPAIPDDYIQWTSVRIKHWGYLSEQERERKYEFYEAKDQDRKKELIGASDYKHLIQTSDLVLTKWKEKNGISLSMITKNESEFILESLRQYWSFCDEMILCDTGSEDETIELASLCGATIHNIPWQDDFALARNIAKNYCKNEWILQMDCDEDFPIHAYPSFRRMIERDVHLFLFEFQNIHPVNVSTTSETFRLYRNIPELYYEGCAHENFDESIIRHPELILEKAPFQCVHKGYLRDRKFVGKKMSNYFDLNQKQLFRNPNDVKALHATAVHLLNVGQIDKAYQILRKADSIKPTLLVKRQLMQLYTFFATLYAQDAINTVEMTDRDREYLRNAVNAFEPYRFYNIPVPHEGLRE